MAEAVPFGGGAATRRREVVDAYREAHATSPDRGFRYDPATPAHARAHDRLRHDGVVLDGETGSWMDMHREAELRQQRQTLLATGLAGMGAILALTLIALR